MQSDSGVYTPEVMHCTVSVEVTSPQANKIKYEREVINYG